MSSADVNNHLHNGWNKIHIMMADDDADAAVKGALEHLLNHADKDVDNDGISQAMKMMRGLLLEPADKINETNHQSSCNETYEENYVSNHQDDDPSTTALCVKS